MKLFFPVFGDFVSSYEIPEIGEFPESGDFSLKLSVFGDFSYNFTPLAPCGILLVEGLMWRTVAIIFAGGLGGYAIVGVIDQLRKPPEERIWKWSVVSASGDLAVVAGMEGTKGEQVFPRK